MHAASPLYPVLWFTGLPGSGKSTIAELLLDALLARGCPAVHLAMDARRKHYIPSPRYTAAEREQAYAMFVEEAGSLQLRGKLVIMDAVAHRRAWREAARERLHAFVEIHVDVPVEVAMEREAARPAGQVQAQLYARAFARQRTGAPDPGLGEVPGVDVPFEPSPAVALTLDAASLSPAQSATQVLDLVLALLDERGLEC